MKYFKFGNTSYNTICFGILITSFILVLGYFSKYSGLDMNSTSIDTFVYYVSDIYNRYLKVIVVFLFLKFVCEFLFHVLKNTSKQ